MPGMTNDPADLQEVFTPCVRSKPDQKTAGRTMATVFRGPRKPRSPQQYARIAVAYHGGASLDDIGLVEEISGNQVGRLLRECGIELRPRGIAADSFRFVPDRKRSAYQRAG